MDHLDVAALDTQDLGAIMELVKRVAPQVHLNSHEKFMPSSVDFYLARVGYKAGGKVIGPPIKAGDLIDGAAGKETSMEFDNSNDAIKRGDLALAECYVHVVGRLQGGYDIQYWLFYPYNGHGTARFEVEFKYFGKKHATGKNISLAPFGEHQGDWELVNVRVDAAGKIIGVYCSQHNSGSWYTEGRNGYELDSAGHPITYSAINGHPNYVRPGRFATESAPDLRIPLSVIGLAGLTFRFYLVNETDRGPVYDCADHHQIVAIDAGSGDYPPAWWLKFLGRWGQVRNSAADRQQAIRTVEAVINSFWWAHLIPGKDRDKVAGLVVNAFYDWQGKILPDGPTGPMTKGNWAGVKGGPS